VNDGPLTRRGSLPPPGGPGPKGAREVILAARSGAPWGPDVADKEAPAQLSFPGWAGSLGLVLYRVPGPPAPGASPLARLLAHAGQLGPGDVEVVLGALGAGAQVAA